MIHLFTVCLYQPLLNLLVFTYNVIPYHDLGVVIIVLTILIKLILYPFSIKTIKAQRAMQELQPKIEEIKKIYKDQKEKQAQEMMKLYKEQKISPFSSCLPLLIQLPFLIAIYQVFNTGLRNGNLSLVYSFIYNPGHINTLAFGFLDLSKPQFILALLAGAAQYLQTKMLIQKRPDQALRKSADGKDEDMMAVMNKQMTIMMPLMTVFIGWNLPSGLVFYWLALTLITALQQLIAFKTAKKLPVEVLDGVPPKPKELPEADKTDDLNQTPAR